ncbi:precorrin-6A reductase [Vagococcus intermedius]|uniref:Precorrin-6A reductase n=1 Tax=Vagococcus intermedius TaxID=2991418 RepID=A0AAF0I6K6_9ENTE|nr:precorrin-6A reductase [Vagococcus intermedius]WEG72735.1 precorrin-6A reductase [Vagococcus intermedius]WEG74821.1 precorrin-6A reductase [Vagococcus intermedius]
MILLLGGTSDAEKIAHQLTKLEKPFIVSVATDYGVSVTKKYTDSVYQGRMDQEQMIKFIKERKITLIIDGTHPFANLVSENAIAASAISSIPYLRYERDTCQEMSGVTHVATSQEACELALKTTGKIYLTVGSKTMAEYVAQLPLERIKTRVLPVVSVIKELSALGLNSDHIEALRGPFSTELNVALLKNAEASVLITKESGTTGGILEKSEACRQLGIPCIMIQRPKVDYPHVIHDPEDVSDWLVKEWHK